MTTDPSPERPTYGPRQVLAATALLAAALAVVLLAASHPLFVAGGGAAAVATAGGAVAVARVRRAVRCEAPECRACVPRTDICLPA